MQLNILILDDEKGIREELEEFFTDNGHKVFTAGLPSQAFAVMQREEVDVAIVDVRLPEMDGLQVLERFKQEWPATEVIIMTAHGDMHTVISSLRLGAWDFFPKPFRATHVLAAIERTKKYLRLNSNYKKTSRALKLASAELQQRMGSAFIGTSKAMREVFDLMGRVAAAPDTTVLVTGESGTGKELVARGVHFLSSRKDSFFHTVNCSAVPETLFESEFFGHKKGSFTGADADKDGMFEIAQNGTLFLDEIGDMPLKLQIKLLRVLEEKKVTKIGSNREIAVDVRAVAATNKDLPTEIDAGNFRLDLYHRLSRFVIRIPPLRERKDDIPVLVSHYLQYFAQKLRRENLVIEPGVVAALSNYSFPGNVRELKNMIENAVILADGDILGRKHFSFLSGKGTDCLELNLFDNEKRLIRQALAKASYNKSKAADLLGITWNSLDRRLKKFSLDYPTSGEVSAKSQSE